MPGLGYCLVASEKITEAVLAAGKRIDYGVDGCVVPGRVAHPRKVDFHLAKVDCARHWNVEMRPASFGSLRRDPMDENYGGCPLDSRSWS